jgi:putative ABC transport system permease protein
MFSELRFRLRALAQRHRVERELDDELRFHLEQETQKYLLAGLPRTEAQRRARLAFGQLDHIKDNTRDVRGVAMIDALWQDIRYAWRGLRAKPGFTTAVVLTFGLGIGANAAMFGIVDRLLFRPPAYLISPDRVHRVFTSYSWDGARRTDRSYAYTRYLDFARATTSFDVLVAYGDRTLAIGVGENARELLIQAASASLFQLFGARPALGRFFTPDEDRVPTGTQVAVLGYGLWQSAYGGQRDVLGKTIQMGAEVYTIIGVAPEGFVGVTEGEAPVAFVPITAVAAARTPDYHQNYNWSWLEIIARRKPGVSLAAANTDLTRAFAQSWEEERKLAPVMGPPSQHGVLGEATSVLLSRGPDAGPDSKVVAWVMGVAVIVLLVACANVANLLLARALNRRREVALRLAIGVTRRRLLQQLLTESLLLAFLGGVAGLAVAQWGGRTIRALFLRAEDTGVVWTDPRTLVFAGVATLVVALLTGIAPVFHTLRSDLAGALKMGVREGTQRPSRLRTGLLVFQGTLSVVLLVGAGLFVRSLSHVRSLDMGYDVERLVYIEGNARGVELNPAQSTALLERLRETAAATPGVVSATLTASVPFWSFEGRGAPHVPGLDSVGLLGRFNLQAGSPNYFETFGTRIVRGRGFTEADRGDAPPVVVVNEAMARALWRDRDPLGQVMRIDSDTAPFLTVVGVAEDMRGSRLRGDPEFWYFLPMAQYLAHYGTPAPYIFARVNGQAEQYTETLRQRLQQEMPGASYVTTRALTALVAPRQRAWEFGATMFVAFGGLALVLAAIGLYSVIAYAVAQRTHELGVRIALGARVSDVLGMVLRQGILFALSGVAIGIFIAYLAGQWVEPLLFAQKARDPVIYVSVALLLLLVALVASLRPAWRAARVDPTVALRAD